jgi:hypothetical protein
MFYFGLQKAVHHGFFFFILTGASVLSGSLHQLTVWLCEATYSEMRPDAQGKYPFTGPFDCTFKTIKAHGPLKLYSGFGVYCIRIAPHVMVNNLSTYHVYAFNVFPFLLCISLWYSFSLNWQLFSYYVKVFVTLFRNFCEWYNFSRQT